MTLLLNGDCLELMKDLNDDSVDLIFCDLPYGQTSCKWDCPIDLDLFWIQVMRIKKLNTPIFMTTTTKFGVSLINSAPKKCFFRYDIVWVKSSAAGFLSAKKMPMRKHEMIYVFYEKLPFYDLSSHQHKFLKEEPKQIIKGENNTYNTEGRKKPIVREKGGKYETPLPVSIVKEETGGATGEPVVNEKYTYKQNKEKDLYGTDIRKEVRTGKGVGKSPIYDPPLPNSMLEIKSTRGKHSTEKPVALMEWILKYYSKEGDVVLDPTMGSGSTGVACKNMNRNFIGFEMDAEIYDGAVNRLT
jgi:site-specific DNA-methyltransferase (adenine-specific)